MTDTETSAIRARVAELLAAAAPPAPATVGGFVALVRGFIRNDEEEQRRADEDAA